LDRPAYFLLFHIDHQLELGDPAIPPAEVISTPTPTLVWRRIPKAGDLPLPYFTRGKAFKKRRSAATALVSLAQRVDGPRVDSSCLNWAARASYMGVANRRTRLEWVPCRRANPASMASSSILTRAEQTASGSERDLYFSRNQHRDQASFLKYDRGPSEAARLDSIRR